MNFVVPRSTISHAKSVCLGTERTSSESICISDDTHFSQRVTRWLSTDVSSGSQHSHISKLLYPVTAKSSGILIPDDFANLSAPTASISSEAIAQSKPWERFSRSATASFTYPAAESFCMFPSEQYADYHSSQNVVASEE